VGKVFSYASLSSCRILYRNPHLSTPLFSGLTNLHSSLFPRPCLALFVFLIFILFSSYAHSADVLLAWDANSTADQITSYAIYYKSGSPGPPYDGIGAYEGDSPIIVTLQEFNDPEHPQYTIHDLDQNEAYFVAITATNEYGESGYSNEITLTFRSNCSDLVTGDLNGDGNADIAGVDSAGKVWHTTDLSTWQDIPGRTLAKIATGDLNGDGNDDIVGVDASGSIWYTANLSTWISIRGKLVELVTGDLDGDGDDDIAGMNAIGRVWYTINLGAIWTQIPGRTLAKITAGDLDGDGDDDIVGVDSSGSIWYTANLSTWASIKGRLVEIVTADLDGDGSDDIAGVSAIGKVWYTINLGTIWTDIPGRTLAKIATGDLDGDGDDDIVGVDDSGRTSYTTDLNSWINIRGILVEIVTADLDGDGNDDTAGVSAIGKVWYTTDLSTWINIPLP